MTAPAPATFFPDTPGCPRAYQALRAACDPRELVAIGPGAEIKLLVQRPPRTMAAAQEIAAEHSAFCTECAGQGLRTVREIAPALVDAPIWTFWWD